MSDFSHAPSVSVLVTGAAFRKKVQLALALLVRKHPGLAAAAKREALALRKQLERGSGYWTDDSGKRDTDMATTFKWPPFVRDWLAMSEFQSQMLLGVPCGTGMQHWFTDPELREIFKQEYACGRQGSLSGITAAAKE